MKKSKTIATIEARMTSSRLPGKVLLEVDGVSLLEILIRRLQKVELIDDIIVATTDNDTDNVICDMCSKIDVHFFRGSEEDVLARVLGAAKSVNADTIVEITGDCPLIDPSICAEVIEKYFSSGCDYASNGFAELNYVDGTDVQVFSTELLELADREGNTKDDREHVSWFFKRNPDRFDILKVPPPEGCSRPDVEITLDEKGDYELISEIIKHFNSIDNTVFGLGEILDFLDANPEIKSINQKVKRKATSTIF